MGAGLEEGQGVRGPVGSKGFLWTLGRGEGLAVEGIYGYRSDSTIKCRTCGRDRAGRGLE